MQQEMTDEEATLQDELDGFNEDMPNKEDHAHGQPASDESATAPDAESAFAGEGTSDDEQLNVYEDHTGEAPVVNESGEPLSADQIALRSAIADLEARYAARADKLDGNYGQVARELAAMRAAAASPGAAARFEYSEESWAGLDDLGLPDLKEVLAKGAFTEIQRAMQSMPGSSVNPDELKRIALEAAHEAQQFAHQQRKDEAIAELREAHPDFLVMQKTPEWNQWFNSLPKAKQVRLGKSNDANYVIDNLDNFVAWRDNAQRKKQQNKARVDNNVTPTRATVGKPAMTLSAREEELAGFNSMD